MSTSYSGQPYLVSALPARSISSSTNATPIVVTTSAAHGLTTGDFVQITSHSTNTAANGIRKVTVLSSTTFELQAPDDGTDIAGVGVGGATGTVTPYAAATAVTNPDDGDAAAAASWNVGRETLGDRAAWAFYRLSGSRVLAQIKKANTTDDTNAAWTGGTSYAVTTWTEVTNVDTFVSNPGDPDIVAGDYIDFEITSAYVSSATTAFSFALYAHAYNYGASPSFASATRLTGASVYYGPAGITPTFSIRWFGAVSAFGGPAANGAGMAVRLYLAAYNRGGAGSVADLFGDRQYTARVWR